MKKLKWPVLIFWICFLSAFPFPVIALHLIGLGFLFLLAWMRILYYLAYGVIKYGIFLGF